MGNLVNTIKKFLSNKNTVTILGVLVGVAVLWGFYTYRVNEATTPIKVPYAKEGIDAATEITEDKIGWVEVNSAFLKNADVITNSSQLVGKYVTTGTSIPEGGLFYTKQVVEKSALPNTVFDDIEDGYTIYSLAVNNHTTYGNSIYPGDKIDLYMRATDETGKIIYGKFITSITVLGVRDSSGKDVFSSSSTSTPAELLFAVPNDTYTLLYKTELVNGVSIIPVPRNKNYTEEGADTTTSDYLKQFILAQSAALPE